MFLTAPIFRVGFFWLLRIKGDKVGIKWGFYTVFFYFSQISTDTSR